MAAVVTAIPDQQDPMIEILQKKQRTAAPVSAGVLE
jgi:hypothetical protein